MYIKEKDYNSLDTNLFLDKFERELNELKEYIKNLEIDIRQSSNFMYKEPLVIPIYDNTKKNIVKNDSQNLKERTLKYKKDENKSIESIILIEKILDYLYRSQDMINIVVKTNIELQAKLSELIVNQNELMKDIKNLVDIFKEAAMEYITKGMLEEENNREGSENREDKEIKQLKNEYKSLSEKLESLEKLNMKLLDVISKLQTNSNLEKKIEKDDNIDILNKQQEIIKNQNIGILHNQLKTTQENKDLNIKFKNNPTINLQDIKNKENITSYDIKNNSLLFPINDKRKDLSKDFAIESLKNIFKIKK